MVKTNDSKGVFAKMKVMNCISEHGLLRSTRGEGGGGRGEKNEENK